jgi:hypothetical protein
VLISSSSLSAMACTSAWVGGPDTTQTTCPLNSQPSTLNQPDELPAHFRRLSSFCLLHSPRPRPPAQAANRPVPAHINKRSAAQCGPRLAFQPRRTQRFR